MIPATLKERAWWKAYVIYLATGVVPGAAALDLIPGWPRFLVFAGVVIAAWNAKGPIQRKVWP